MLRDLGSASVSQQGARIYVNGDLVGSHSDPVKLVSEIRERRRCGILSDEINIHYNEDMDEVYINCDEGRLRRPLLVIKEGKTVITRRHLEGIRDHKIKWEDLFREGIMERCRRGRGRIRSSRRIRGTEQMS